MTKVNGNAMDRFFLAHAEERTNMRWEYLPMVRTIFVDFDLGTGLAVSGALGPPT